MTTKPRPLMDLNLLDRFLFAKAMEDSGLRLSDGATRIFLNTHGTNSKNVSPELIELLEYMEHTTDQVSRNCKSDRIHQIHNKVSRIKSSEEIGVKYMQEWEEKILEQRKAREEGKNALLLEQIQKKLAKGCTPEVIADALETDLSVINELILELSNNTK